MLRSSASVLETSYEVGLSGPGRLHDLFVTHEAMSPGEFKAGGEGLTISYGFHPCPFGTALVMTTPRGLCGPGARRRRQGSLGAARHALALAEGAVTSRTHAATVPATARASSTRSCGARTGRCASS